MSLEIYDAGGALVRRYASNDSASITDDELAKQLVPIYWVARPRADSPAPPACTAGYGTCATRRRCRPTDPIRSPRFPHRTPRAPFGPLVVPGEFTVRMTVGGRSYDAPLLVKMDPRVRISQSALERQLRLARRLAAMMSSSAAAVMQARSIGEQLARLERRAPAAIDAAAKGLGTKITALLDGAPHLPPDAKQATLAAVNDHVNDVYAVVTGADSRPTAAAVEATAKLEAQLANATQRWRDIAGIDVPALSRQLHGANLPDLRLDLPPQNTDAGRDSESTLARASRPAPRSRRPGARSACRRC